MFRYPHAAMSWTRVVTATWVTRQELVRMYGHQKAELLIQSGVLRTKLEAVGSSPGQLLLLYEIYHVTALEPLYAEFL